MKIRSYILLATVVLALSACGTDDPGQAGSAPTAIATEDTEHQPPSADSQSAPSDLSSIDSIDFENLEMTTDDELVFISSMGAKGTLEFVGDDDPRVADLENYFTSRAAVNGTGLFAEDISGNWEYLVAEVDNLAGLENVNMSSVTLFDSDMTTYTFTNAYSHVQDSNLIGDIGHGFALGVDPENPSTSEEFKNLEVSPEEFWNVRDLSGEAGDAVTQSIGPQEQATFVLVMLADDIELPHELEMVEVATYGDLTHAPAYNLPMDEYEEWLAEYENEQEYEYEDQHGHDWEHYYQESDDYELYYY